LYEQRNGKIGEGTLHPSSLSSLVYGDYRGLWRIMEDYGVKRENSVQLHVITLFNSAVEISLEFRVWRR
jgi:hypothetical protein